MRAFAIAAAVGAAWIGVGCSDTTGPDLEVFVISGRVTGAPGGVPLANATVLLRQFKLSPAPGGSGSRTFGSATSDAAGGYELRAEVKRLDCNSLMSLESFHGAYYQAGLIQVPCASGTVDIELLLKILSVRIDPQGGDVEPGSETSFLATATMADGSTGTSSDLWDIRWHIDDVSAFPRDCGSLQDDEANPVLFTAPAVAPDRDCSVEGGADIALVATFFPEGVEERILVTVREP